MIEIRKAKREELEQLREVAIVTFVDEFGSFNTPENMEVFLKEAYDPAQLAKEWEEKDTICYLAWEGQIPVGFARLRINAEVETLLGNNSIELHRLYVHPNHQGMKVGSQLMQQALDYSMKGGFNWIWLGVWERNAKAQEFYRHWGFQRFSEHIFQMGDDPQIDWLLRKKLE
jgi:ribosomal protein S18 acetylase RimI-like enzyme